MNIQAPRGTKDIYGQEVIAWQRMERVIRDTCRNFGFGEIRTPMFEHTELFKRGVGETTDVVQKEMYELKEKGDKDNHALTLRPEGTAGVVRALIEHSLFGAGLPVKLYYMGPMFRYEKPQAGRMRQFHQLGAEIFGADTPAADAEMISLAYQIITQLGLEQRYFELQINSLGCPACRSEYNKRLKAYIQEHIDGLCATCRERAEKNPLRVLDCKVGACADIMANAPSVLDALDDDCRKHFEDLQKCLTAMKIPFTINPRIVRGLDYYTKTVFEFVCKDIGAQSTICGGGRYDGLVQECGGPALTGVGFGMGMERLLLAIEDQKAEAVAEECADIFVGSIGENGFYKAQEIIFELRRAGIAAEGDTLQRSIKAQMKYANKLKAKHALIIGDDESATNVGKVKNMTTGEQVEVPLDSLAGFIKLGKEE